MPPTAFPWVVVVLTLSLSPLTHTAPSDSTPLPRPDVSGSAWGAVGGEGNPCGGAAPPVTPPVVSVAWERNSSQVGVSCPPKLRTFFPSFSSEPPQPDPPSTSAPSHPLATIGEGGRGVVLNLTHLQQEGVGGQVVVDVEGCGCVGVAVGLPMWAEGLTFAIRGSLRFPRGWWAGGVGVRDMWVRVHEGLGGGGVCDYLPPTLETLDLSDTPLGELVLEETCVPRSLQRLEAIWSALTRVKLCTPSLTTLYINNNEVGGEMEWAGCEGGVSGVMYLHASHNHLTTASTCTWPSLSTLELRGNWLTSLDLSTCPPLNLTSLIASRNYLTVAPALPPVLVILDLSHNNISTLPVFPRTLQEADFSYNSLELIGEGRFGRARKLHHLTLAHNHLTGIEERDFYGLRRLHRLDLSHNKLETIAANAMLPLRHLRHLHLHHNHLTQLDARILNTLTQTLNAHATLHNNPWECNCQMLAALTQLQACAECKHKRVALECREREHIQEVSSLLRTCLHAIQHTQGQVDESDEDLSEEIADHPDEGAAGAVLVVPSLVVIIVLAVSVACGYRLYKKHRRVIVTTLTPYCACCDRGCAGGGIGDSNHNSHRHHQEASQLPTGELQDSDTETEM
ncbi:uncharacterized protein LOC123499554 [Portunus trituberculatus]|uniref:uncharacterized protein LOC123499554 n=1 Tax=Portunus trituberculatus TaxID=210409 RepID=UPI001E1CBD41|nr:uncharacterized protein LOC123499554 [Portunus trituberculatus]